MLSTRSWEWQGHTFNNSPNVFLGVFFTYTYRDEVDVCDPKWMSASWKLNDADTDDTLILQFDKFIVVNSVSLNLLKIPYSKSHYITILLPISPQYPRVLYTCHPPRISWYQETAEETQAHAWHRDGFLETRNRVDSKPNSRGVLLVTKVINIFISTVSWWWPNQQSYLKYTDPSNIIITTWQYSNKCQH